LATFPACPFRMSARPPLGEGDRCSDLERDADRGDIERRGECERGCDASRAERVRERPREGLLDGVLDGIGLREEGYFTGECAARRDDRSTSS